jgi:hypothetical protein
MQESKINWRYKLSSRKFWALLIGFIVPLMTALNFTENQIAQAASLVMSGAAVVAYILGESWVDSARESSDLYINGKPAAEWDDEDFDVLEDVE